MKKSSIEVNKRGEMVQATKQHIVIVKEFFEEVLNKGNLSLMDGIFTNDVKYNDPANPNLKKGLLGLKELETKYKMAFPTKIFKIEQIWNTTDNSVIVYWSCQGTHKGTYEDIPPSGKSFKTSGISIYKFNGNKINEITQNWDKIGLLEHLGLSIHAHAGEY